MQPYKFHITPFDLVFLATLIAGLTLALLLGFKRSGREANLLLGLALAIIVLKTGGLTPLLLPAVGPLLYFYVRQSTHPDRRFHRKDMLHFCSLLVVYWMPGWLVSISVIIYLYLAHRLIQDFYNRLRPVLMDRPRFAFRWLDRVLLLLGLCCALSLFNDTLWLAVAIVLIGMAADAILKPDSIQQVMPMSDRSDAREKSRRLKEAVVANRLYEDAELTLATLAIKLNIHPHDLSRIINVGLEKNFSDFINEFRVRAVARKVQDPAYDRLTLIGIAYESGFNSERTFHRVFKEMTGKTPLEYKNSLRKELPIDKLATGPRIRPVILRSGSLQNWSPKKLNRNFMFRNYLKIAWRNMVRQKLFSLINISGLAVGLAVCMLIMIYVAHEHSYDRFSKNAERIFIPNAMIKMRGNIINTMGNMSYASGPLISQGQPTLENYMRILPYFKPVIANNTSFLDKKFSEKNVVFADPGFFKFFSFKILSGDANSVLANPYSIVISQEMAKKYFGDENPIGKTITLKTDSAYTYQVTGVAENCPSNSSIQYNFVVPNSRFLTMKEAKDYLGPQKIGFGTFKLYLLLKHASDTVTLKRSLDILGKKNKDFQDMTFSLKQMADMHLNFSDGDQSNTKYLQIFPLVAVLVLLLALVNYMSLSTAQATLRAKEIGIRKVSGASRKSIAAQFYIESGLYAILSFVLGYVICYLFKPVFLNVLQLKIDDSFLYSPILLTLSGILLLVTILAAGSYPSFVLSAFNPAVTLKGKMNKQSGAVTVRKVFTTLQFAISVGLIICGIIIDRQLYYFRHADTGINKENIVMIPVGSSFGKNYASFYQDVKSLAAIEGVTTSRYAMFTSYDAYEMDGKTKDQTVMLNALAVDKNFMSVLGLKWKNPPLSSSLLSGSGKVVINELAIERLNLSGNPVGAFVKSGSRNLEIAGVVKNFNFGSMEYAIQPLGLFITPDTLRYWTMGPGCNLFARIKPHTNLPTLLSSIEEAYKRYDKDTPFNYTFMDDSFNAQYKAEDRLASIFSIFTVITIVLAGMGLFGLAAFTIEQRTKEIGIRKVLGASISSINGLLSKDFLKLVLLSILIASPVAWYVMHNWLQGFAYRISIQWWMFAGAGLLAVMVAIITISYHTIKAAIVNPVKSLRSE